MVFPILMRLKVVRHLVFITSVGIQFNEYFAFRELFEQGDHDNDMIRMKIMIYYMI